MCNGSCNSAKLSTGGTIAVLRPTACISAASAPVDDLLHTANPAVECDLLFENSGDHAGNTQAIFRTKDGSRFDAFRGHFMVIHRDGDARNAASLREDMRNALHTIEISAAPDATASGLARMELPEELQLSVGGQGVIGRRVSIMTGMRDSGARVAEGIIGWN
ncbi:uncharacterized protein K452DRAFT_359358 [Aplosporella prunicola CBS 121167]|uniref:Uncharacterized protein n=1 Tax=Aplosporella prunicola CBS 121167 TaxID=1176127 RepID=A0A6A6BA87_9PEZI|nr:uncharacterized protein K452DRAFT_359358 [Aplosporella prunicola CBS 121167]KAF2140936.1 hypothetical protein K452DRAFT_359358 [Aplosporella prunicola CBS 121167]